MRAKTIPGVLPVLFSINISQTTFKCRASHQVKKKTSAQADEDYVLSSEAEAPPKRRGRPPKAKKETTER